MEELILVYIDLKGSPTLVGHLWVHSKQNRQSISFEYDRAWLKSQSRFALDPVLQPEALERRSVLQRFVKNNLQKTKYFP